MGNFKRDNKRFNNRDNDRPSMHKAVCSECGSNCEIPFKPTGTRPVFCSSCFESQGGNRGRSNKFSSGRHERSSFRDRDRDRQMHDVVCDKCGKNCQVPFKPTAGKPVFCDDCFKRGESGSRRDSGEVMEQIGLLNAKIDKIIKILIPENSVKKPRKPRKPKKPLKTSKRKSKKK